MVKTLLLLGACALASPAFANDFTYDISTGFDAGAHDWITTNCDNCALTSSNIVAWSLSQTFVPPADFDGPLLTASSMSHSSALVQGSVFVAKPNGLFFDFTPGSSFGNVQFTSGGNWIQFTNSPDFLAYSAGTMNYCSDKSAVCFGSSVTGVQQMGTRAKATPAPELGGAGTVPMLSMALGLVAVLGSRRRVAISSTRRA